MKITTLIFDLGGVIINLDPQRTIDSFRNLGLHITSVNESLPVFNEFEKGLISEEQFRSELRPLLRPGTTDAQIDEAWNHMLLDIPHERWLLLQSLRKEFRLYLLSNTNAIHKTAFVSYFEATFTDQLWPDQFDRIFYSHEIGLRKPHREIYDKVLEDIGVPAGACIFIDDNKQNLEGAKEAGIQTIWAEQPLSEKMVEQIRGICRSASLDGVAE